MAADTIEITAGSGTKVETDKIGTDHFQVVKLAYGAYGDGNIVTSTTVQPLPVAFVPGTAATSLGKQEDEAHTTGDVGVMMLAVRTDTAAAAIADTTGDYTPLQVNDAGALYVDLESGAIDGLVDNATFQPTSSEGIGVLGAYEATPTGLGDNDVAFIGLDVNRAVRVGGTEATDLGKEEDEPHASGDTGIMPLAVRNDALAALGGTDGDYAPLQVSALGAQYVTLAPETAGGLSVFNDNDLDETAVVVKAAEGQVYSIHAVNLDATPCYLQLFNVAQGSVTVGTTPPTMEFVIPSQGDANGAGFTINFPHGIAFSTAITAAATTTTEGAIGPGNNEVHVVIGYK